jgi:hypothetical protein
MQPHDITYIKETSKQVTILQNKYIYIYLLCCKYVLRDQFGTVFIIAIAALIKKMSDVDAFTVLEINI